MKILVSTKKTQGRRGNDFSWCNEGEVLGYPIIECTYETVDGGCGCMRSFTGLDTAKATTTALVVESDMTEAEMVKRVKESLERRYGGELAEYAEREAKEMLRLAKRFEDGEVVERRGNKVLSRGVFKHVATQIA